VCTDASNLPSLQGSSIRSGDSPCSEPFRGGRKPRSGSQPSCERCTTHRGHRIDENAGHSKRSLRTAGSFPRPAILPSHLAVAVHAAPRRRSSNASNNQRYFQANAYESNRRECQHGNGWNRTSPHDGEQPAKASHRPRMRSKRFDGPRVPRGAKWLRLFVFVGDFSPNGCIL